MYTRYTAPFRWLPLVLYVLTIVGANLAIERFGMVPVGFGLLAPAGVYCAGLAFGLRDLVQERLGLGWAYLAIGSGCLLSLAVSPVFAVASAAAFLASEMVDLLVYSGIRPYSRTAAVYWSGLAGLTVDSLIFLRLAFGSWEHLDGQLVGKLWMTLLAVAALWVWQLGRRIEWGCSFSLRWER